MRRVEPRMLYYATLQRTFRRDPAKMPNAFRFQRTLILIACLLFIPVPLLGQTNVTGGNIAGIVRDQTGGVLPGTTVTAVNEGTNLSRTTVVEPNGRFLLPALPPGIYTLRLELAGFAPQVLAA